MEGGDGIDSDLLIVFTPGRFPARFGGDVITCREGVTGVYTSANSRAVFTFDETAHIGEVFESIAKICPLTRSILEKYSYRFVSLSTDPRTGQII